MQAIDWTIILAYFAFLFGIGFLVKGTASESMEGFFSAGRGMPWWLIGVSLVATTFAADTPLVISGWVATYGTAGNWFWWGGVIGQVALTVFFARKWRTSGVVTDVELTELRYGGKPALVLRTTKAAISALLVNIVTLGWVFAAMRKIVKPIVKWGEILPQTTYEWLRDNLPSFLIFKDIDNTITVFILVTVVVIYVTVGGLKAVMITDFFQFSLALFCAYLIAWIAINNQFVDGLGDLWVKLKELYPSSGEDVMFSTTTDAAGKAFLSWKGVSAFIPSFSSTAALMPFSAFVLTIGVLWWTNGAIDGSGFTAQRLNTAKTPADAERGSYFYTLLNFCLRHWPWVLAGLAALIIFPRTEYDMLARQTTQCVNGTCVPMEIKNVGLVDASSVKICIDNPANCKIRGFEMLYTTRGTLEQDGAYPLSTTVPSLNQCLKNEESCSAVEKNCIVSPESCIIAGFSNLKRVERVATPAETAAPPAASDEVANLSPVDSAAGAVETSPGTVTADFASIAAGIERFELLSGAEQNYAQITVYKEDREMAYPLMISTLMGPGFLGLTLASLMAAFMSTVASQINWGASYLTNDFYYRLIDRNATQKRLVIISRLSIIVMTLISVFIANQVDNIGFMWELWGGMMAGMGLPHILRWLWWRANAWTEITGMVTGIIVAFINLFFLDSQLSAIIVHAIMGQDYVYQAVPIHNIGFISLFAGIAAIIGTLVTKPVPEGLQKAFAEKVEPMGWWRGMNKMGNKQRSVKFGVVLWLTGVISVYAIMFGLGYYIRMQWLVGTIVMLIGIVALILMLYGLSLADKVDTNTDKS